MKKLFVKGEGGENCSHDELDCAYKKFSSNELKIEERELTVEMIEDNNISVVISSGLSKQWYLTLRGMFVITITLGCSKVYADLSDIVIDCLANNDKRYFVSEEYSACNNTKNKIGEVFDIISYLEWDSRFWGFNVSYLSCLHLTESIMAQISKYIYNNNIRLVEYLCNCHDLRSVRVAEKNGFNFVDIRLNYYHTLLNIGDYQDSEGMRFGVASDPDIPALRRVAESSYEDSRYFFDGNFDNEKVSEFYQSWVEKGVTGRFDDICLCLYDGNTPFAFSTVKYVTKEEASMGLVGVSPSYMGKGYGKSLMHASLTYLKENGVKVVSVVTQGRNYPAQNLYQSVGFRLKTTQLWYHKWI